MNGIPTVLLLRQTSNSRFIASHLPQVEVRPGAITDPRSLGPALAGVTHVIHCAGCTRGWRKAEFHEVNHLGTRHVVEAVNSCRSQIKRLVYISSLAAFGPATAARPARETESPHPISEYGRSKLAGESEVRQNCRVDSTILRPPAVYGPRDSEFLPLFKAAENHLLPRPSARQQLSLVFVRDLAEAAVASLQHSATAGKTYFVASPEVTNGREIAAEIAALFKHWTVPLPLPLLMLWLACIAQEVRGRLTGEASILNLQKYPELRASGWVCDGSRFERDTGQACKVGLKDGISQTLAWYRENKWL